MDKKQLARLFGDLLSRVPMTELLVIADRAYRENPMVSVQALSKAETAAIALLVDVATGADSQSEGPPSFPPRR